MLITRPPMGWNSWNTYGNDINEDLIKETADAMVASGLKDAGYEYVVIDDCWSVRGERDEQGNLLNTGRDEQGRLVADPVKFPSGMKALADYIHEKGLKFGMYSCDGPFTCAGYPASYDYEFIDAKTFAEWGVDYLKYDNCYKPELPGRVLYNRMSMALKASGRDIVFSACNWGAEDVWSWIRSTGAHLYRSTGDINDSYGSFMNIAISQFDKQTYNTPGCFNDIDMLITGMYGKGNVAVGGCTESEYLFHFALWCFFQSPLMIGCDIRNMSKATKETLMNKELIRINQDAECRPPFLAQKTGKCYSFLKHLEGGEYALGYFNFSEDKTCIPCDFYNFGLHKSTGMALDLFDVVNDEQYLNCVGGFGATVEPHYFRIYRCKLHPAK